MVTDAPCIRCQGFVGMGHDGPYCFNCGWRPTYRYVTEEPLRMNPERVRRAYGSQYTGRPKKRRP